MIGSEMETAESELEERRNAEVLWNKHCVCVCVFLFFFILTVDFKQYSWEDSKNLI